MSFHSTSHLQANSKLDADPTAGYKIIDLDATIASFVVVSIRNILISSDGAGWSAPPSRSIPFISPLSSPMQLIWSHSRYPSVRAWFTFIAWGEGLQCVIYLLDLKKHVISVASRGKEPLFYFFLVHITLHTLLYNTAGSSLPSPTTMDPSSTPRANPRKGLRRPDYGLLQQRDFMRPSITPSGGLFSIHRTNTTESHEGISGTQQNIADEMIHTDSENNPFLVTVSAPAFRTVRNPRWFAVRLIRKSPKLLSN